MKKHEALVLLHLYPQKQKTVICVCQEQESWLKLWDLLPVVPTLAESLLGICLMSTRAVYTVVISLHCYSGSSEEHTSLCLLWSR